MYDINLQSRTPLYEQVYKKIVELVANKALKPDDKIPSVRTLAKELGVNPNTVSKAYLQLENDKIIYTLAGRGSFISNLDVGKVQEKILVKVDQALEEAYNVGVSKDKIIDRIDKKWGALNDRI